MNASRLGPRSFFAIYSRFGNAVDQWALPQGLKSIDFIGVMRHPSTSLRAGSKTEAVPFQNRSTVKREMRQVLFAVRFALLQIFQFLNLVRTHLLANLQVHLCCGFLQRGTRLIHCVDGGKGSRLVGLRIVAQRAQP